MMNLKRKKKRGGLAVLPHDGAYSLDFLDSAQPTAFDLGLASLLDEREEEDATDADFPEYADKPVEFTREILGAQITDDIARVLESVRHNPVTEARSANGVGKTHGAAHAAVWFYKCFPYSQVYTTAAPPEGNLKRLLWGEIYGIIRHRPLIFERDSVTSLHIARSEKDFITGVTIPTAGTAEARESKFSGKHAAHILFIVDEGDAVPAEVYKGIESCMSGGVLARLLILFNPRHQSGPVWVKERDRRANVIKLSAFGHPNVITGDHVFAGAVTRETTVRRINEWSRQLTADEREDGECFRVPPFLAGCTAKSLDGQREFVPLPAGVRKITDSALAYMTLGEYPAQASDQLISLQWVSNARTRFDAYTAQHGEKPPALVRPIQAVDIAEMGDDENVSTLRYGGFFPKQRAWGGIDTLETADKAANIHKDRNCERTITDATGVGAGVAPAMRRQGCKRVIACKVATKPTKKTEMGVFAQMRDQLYWALREWLRTDPGAMLPPDEWLIEELLTPTYEVKNGVIKVMEKPKMREKLKRSPDRLDSLSLTFYDGSAPVPDTPTSPLAKAVRSRGYRAGRGKR